MHRHLSGSSCVQKNDDRIIKTVKTFDQSEYDARTCVRMAFKAFEMGFKFDFGNIDPTDGTLAKSHKEKFDKMLGWVDSPFHEYKCNTCTRRVSSTVTVTTYVLKKKHDRVKCNDCNVVWANMLCSHKRCKKCCVKHTKGSNVNACKVKSHRQ